MTHRQPRLIWLTALLACTEAEAPPATLAADTASAGATSGVDVTAKADAAQTESSVGDSAALLDQPAAADTDMAKDAAAPPDAADAADVPPKPSYTAVSVACGATPTAGAVLAAPPKAYSSGKCPVLVADGKTLNTLNSKGNTRHFKLIAPADKKPGEALPVLFAWHWLKGSAKSFIETGELASAVAQQRFVAVVPESKGDIEIPLAKASFPWPITSLSPAARFEEEFTFFDDMLACVAEQYAIDAQCVSVVGVSAGALFGAQLAQARSEHIASFLSLSGGTQSDGLSNLALLPWKGAKHKLPVLVLWGGPQDSCALVNFQSASLAMQKALDKEGHFQVECIHNCQHGVPPVDAPEGVSQFKALWDFAWSHPYWLPPGHSPWAKGLPADAPPWCAVGPGTAKIRTGQCPPPSCPL
ncbi:MAG: hypothetical protein FJ100_06645 [Deltaproteobacteria bacterium]|nr:hypothetical protein [Deltaproteobacteria bacterium]